MNSFFQEHANTIKIRNKFVHIHELFYTFMYINELIVGIRKVFGLYTFAMCTMSNFSVNNFAGNLGVLTDKNSHIYINRHS